MIVEYFLENLRILMRDKGDVKQGEIAIALDVSQTSVSNWWRRETIPSPEHIEKLSKYFNVEPHYFFMKPGTQGKTEATDDYFKAYVDRVAEKSMPPQLLTDYKHKATGRLIIQLVEGNYNRIDSIEGAPDWFRFISPLIGEQFSLDLEAKLKRILQEIQKKKEQKSS